MARIFVYDDREFPDPDPEMSVDQVKGTLSDFYGEIANASVKETKRGEDTIYEFQRRVGTKGAFTCRPHLGRHHMDNLTFTGLLAATPPADLRIIELTAELTRPDGSFDLDAAAARQPEVELACVPGAGLRLGHGTPLGGDAMQAQAAAPARLSGLAGLLLRRPPSLRELVTLVGYADDYAWFAGLVRRLFPQEAEAALAAPDVRQRVECFARSSWSGTSPSTPPSSTSGPG